MRIGELLIMNGLITEEQLAQALRQQEHTPKKIGEILAENGIITERQLAEALEFQLGVPVVQLNETVFDRSTLQLVHESLARKHRIIPIHHKHGKIKVAMVDPLNEEAIKEIQMATGMSVQPMLTTRLEMEQALTVHYGLSVAAGMLSGMIESAVQQMASSIHLDWQEERLTVRYRIESVLQMQQDIPKPLQEAFVERIKYAAGLSASEEKLPQEGRFQHQIEQKDFEIVVSTLPAVYGESLTLRIKEKSQKLLELSELGLSESNLQAVTDAIRQPKGMILISGPSGSGQTSLLYSLLMQMKKEEHKIITVESPIEYRLPGIIQVEVNDRIGLSFSQGLRAVLRQDPDIVIAGELDAETLQMAAAASREDVLFLGSIRTAGAIEAIREIMNMGVDRQMIASSLSYVISQRLVPRVCGQCAQTMPASDEELKHFESHGLLKADDSKSSGKTMIGNFRSFMAAQISGKATVNRGNGCRLCNQTGYRGFVGIHDVIKIDDSLREFLAQNRTADEIAQYLNEKGHKSMLVDGLLKAREGMTTVEQVLQTIHSM
ncbi:GspE/PulE family protein [Ferviditalea candida]|uniref:ATPase, T2SS/T4P/T4SS family n=1 Tax=Ferviditalea candida TaxID=3108399 RepID=A0ABU5ZGT9_9BACL|nr:ATPase, T2SS/T4P/T4SS family [Paenibacillaceae bacterium T2]